MDSIRCPDCSTEVSSSEMTCPSCNFPISKLLGLSSAVLTKDSAMVAGLIQLGADVNSVDRNGRTPLMLAASIGSVQIVQMLLAAGAKLEFVNSAGETALTVAKSKDVEKILRRALVVLRFTSLHKKEVEAPVTPEQADATGLQEVTNRQDEEVTIVVASSEEPSQSLQTNEPEHIEALRIETPKIDNHIDAEEVVVIANIKEPSPNFQITDFDKTQPLPSGEMYIVEVSLSSPEVEEGQSNSLHEEIHRNTDITDYEEPLLNFQTNEQSHAELSIWENRKEPDVAAIKFEPDLEEPVASFEKSPQEQVEGPEDDYVEQAEEEPAIATIDEYFASFQTNEQSQAEMSVWENRKEPDVAAIKFEPDLEELAASFENSPQEQLEAPEDDYVEQAEEEPAIATIDEYFASFQTNEQSHAEMSVWENRKEPDVAAIKFEPDLEEPVASFEKSPQEQVEAPEDDYVEQAEEEPAIATITEFSASFQTNEQSLAEMSVWENRAEPDVAAIKFEPDLEEPVASFEKSTQEQVEAPEDDYVEQAEEEPAIATITEFSANFETNEPEQMEVSAVETTALNSAWNIGALPLSFKEDDLDTPGPFGSIDSNIEESAMTLNTSEQEPSERMEWESRKVAEESGISVEPDFEEPSIRYITSQQIHSQFEERENWIEIEQAMTGAEWNSEEPTIHYEIDEQKQQEFPQVGVSKRSDVLHCLECDEVIGANEIKCSNCHTTIVRRYCSHCSRLIPDRSMVCAFCGKSVTEHFSYSKRKPEKFLLGMTIGVSVLLLLLFVNWQQSSESPQPALQREIRSLPKIPKAPPPKAEPKKSVEVIFVPPEATQNNKKEIPADKTEIKTSRVKGTNVIKEPLKKSPTKVTMTKKEPSVQRPNVAAVKSSWSKPAQKPLDQEKIKKAQSLNSQGFSLIKQGRPSEAIPLLEQSLRSFPKGTNNVHYAYALFNLGVAWRMAGRPDIAIPILEKRIKINNQRDVVARELDTAKKQARESGFGSFQ